MENTFIKNQMEETKDVMKSKIQQAQTEKQKEKQKPANKMEEILTNKLENLFGTYQEM